MYSANGKNRSHSGQGHLVENVIVFAVLFVIFVAGFYATSFAELFSAPHAWWPMIGVIGGGTLVFMIGMNVFGRSDAHPDRTANEAQAAAQVDAEYAEALQQSARRH